MNRRKLFTLATLAILYAGSALFVLAHAQEPMKVAFVYVGPVGDAGWTYAHEQGRLAMQAALGAQVQSRYVENVAEGADAERVIRKLAADGNKLIFTTSFGFMNGTEKVARAYPNVVFEHATGYKMAKNMGVYETRQYEGTYLQGVLAAKMSKTGMIGFVGSFPVPEVIRNINAYTLGAQSVNPKIKTRVVWVSSWYDPAKERQAAETLIAQGADVLTQNTDSPATLQVAQEKGKYAFGWDSDMVKFAPKAHLSATTNSWGDFYTKTARAVLAGTWKSAAVHGGLAEGMVKMSPLNAAVPADAAKLFDAKKTEIASGKFKVFRGPLKDQSGAIKVTAGTDMAPNDLMAMSWYVQGVEGTIPK